MLGLGVTPTEILLQAVGSADDPSSGGRQMPCALGQARAATSSPQSSPTGSQCIPAVGCAEAGALHRAAAAPARAASPHGDELTYVSLGEGACSEGEFWESLNTACNLHLPVLYVVADNGFAISVPTTDQHPAPVAELVPGFRGLEVHRLDGTDYFGVRTKARDDRRAGARRRGPGADPRRRRAAVLALGGRHAEQVPLGRRAGRRGDPRPDRPAGGRARRRRRAHARRGRRACGPRRRRSWPRRRPRRWPARRPDPARVTDHVYVLPGGRRRRRPTYDGGDAVPLGEAIQPHAARGDGGRRAHPGVRRGRRRRPRGGARQRRGQGRRVRHDARPAARVRPGPLLQHAAVGGEHHRPGGRPGAPRAAPGARDPVLRLHLAGHDADQERGGHDPLALERGVHRARWCCGCRSAAT